MKATSLVTILLIWLMFTSAKQSAAQAPDWMWAKSFGSAVQMIDERGESIAVDASGNVYTVGEFAGTVDFDQGAGTFNITSYGYTDVFISKLDAAGNFIWTQRLGGTGFEYGSAITIDPTGNYIYVTGSFEGTCDFDPGASTFNMSTPGGQDIFVCKLDVSGNFTWAKQMDGASTQNNFATGIITDNTGNIYSTGYFYGSVDFDPGNGIAISTASGNYSDIYISKLDVLGNYIWSRQMGGTGDDRANSICIDHSGNGDVYTTGYFSGTADFDPGNGTSNLTAAGQRDIFISRLDASGNFVWAKAMSGTSLETGNEITFDVAGNLWLTGSFYSTVDFDPGPNVFNLTSAGIDDIFIAKLNTSGNLLLAQRIGSQSWDDGLSITADSMGNVFTTGFFNGTADFDADSTESYNLTSIGDSDVFVTRMDLSGNLIWATSAGGTKGESGLSIAFSFAGDTYVSGYYRSSTVAFSNNTIANADIGGSLVSDAFVAKLGQNTGVRDLQKASMYNLYPNPCTGHTVLACGNSLEKKISLYNLQGSLVSDFASATYDTDLRLENIMPGIYFVKVATVRSNEVLKLVVE